MNLRRRCTVVVLAAAGACLPLQSQNPQAAAPQNRIVAPIDENNRVALSGTVHPLAQARFDRGAAPSTMATGRIMLLLQRSAAQQQALTQYLADVQNPGSPTFHQWLTPSQYGAMFGPTASDVQTVESWLQSQGFKIEKVPQARNFIQFSGTAGQLQNAFQTSIHAFAVGGETHYANVNDPQIPAALAPVVGGVAPLNDFRPKPHLVKGDSGHYDATTHTIEPDLTLFNGSTPLLFVDPADAATIYDTPSTTLNANFTSGTAYDGTGVNLGIVGVSDLTVADVSNYRQAFLGETSSTVNLPTVIVDGEDPGLNGAAVEALLDNEVSGGIAPKAKVYFYTSADSDIASGLYNAIIRAVDDNTVSILSMSFGECEAGLGSGGNAFFLEVTQQAAAQGISFTVSAGDGGSAGCDDFDTEEVAQDGLAVSGMASTPWVIAVGGTDFDTLPGSFATYVNVSSNGAAPYYRTALKYIPENPWNDSTTVDTLLASDVAAVNSLGETNIVAGSGGVSTVYGKPAFQTSLTPTDNARDVPDVSFFASNGNKQAVWALCSDNVTNGDPTSIYTNCQTAGGQLANGTSIGGVGGTSASAPAFAGMLALVAQSRSGARLGQADAILYQLAKSKYATVFHDVTVGNNSVPCATGSTNCGTNKFLTGYNTAVGYDLATGLGSIDINQLIKNWGSVALTTTATTLNINGSTAAYTGVHGATLTFNVGVTPTAATGAVAVIDTANLASGGTASGAQADGQLSIALASGAGTATWNGLPGGTYTVSARYGGDTSDASSSSTPISVTISPEPSTTSLSVRAYNAQTGTGVGITSIPYGSYVFADAGITGTAEGSKTQGTATGTVTYSDVSSTLGTAGVSGNGNQATWPAQSIPYYVFAVGAHNVTAKYSGDASFGASTSSAAAFTVVKGATSMTGVGGSPVNAESWTYANVTITTPYNLGVAPTGTVTMTANGTTVGTITGLLSGINISGTTILYQLTGSGQIFGGNLGPGNNVVTLTYSGDGNYAGTSTTVNIYNTSGVGSFAMSNSGNMTLMAGQSGNETITITPAGGFISSVVVNCAAPTPITCATGLTTNVSGTSAVLVNIAMSATAGGTPGTYPVTISGVNDTGKITASTTFNVTVNPIPANAGITLSTPGPISIDAASTYTSGVTITPTNGYVGVLNLTCAVTTTMSSPTSPPVCSVGATSQVTSTTAVTDALGLSTTATTTTGSYTLTITATDQNNSSITANTQVALTVSGQPTLGLTNSANITISPGATTGNASTITVTPGGGFTGGVNLSCALTSSPSGASELPTCGVPSSVMISGTTAATATLTIYTTGATSGALDLPLKKFFVAGGGGALALVLFFGIPARRRGWRALFSVLALVAIAGAIGCGGGGNGGGGGGGGGGNPGTTAGAYTVTVTGTDTATGKITSTVAVTVTVN